MPPSRPPASASPRFRLSGPFALLSALLCVFFLSACARKNPAPTAVYNASKTSLALVVGDGDNVQYMKGSRATWMAQRVAACAADPATGCFPLLWTVSPHLLHLAPDMLRWFLAAHYRFNRRLDTPFWRAARADVALGALAPPLPGLAQLTLPLVRQDPHVFIHRD